MSRRRRTLRADEEVTARTLPIARGRELDIHLASVLFARCAAKRDHTTGLLVHIVINGLANRQLVVLFVDERHHTREAIVL